MMRDVTHVTISVAGASNDLAGAEITKTKCLLGITANTNASRLG